MLKIDKPMLGCLKPIKTQISRAKTPNSGKILAIMALLLTLLTSFNAWADEIDDIIPFVIQAESAGNPHAVSKDGCVGLMQISPIVLREYNANVSNNERYYRGGYNTKTEWIPIDYKNYTMEDMFDSHKNKLVGTWYLRRLRDHYLKDISYWLSKPYKGTMEEYRLCLILAAYNGGITRLRKCRYDINKMPKETRDYVRKIMKSYKKAR